MTRALFGGLGRPGVRLLLSIVTALIVLVAAVAWLSVGRPTPALAVSGTSTPALPAAAAAGNIGGYPEQVTGVAFGVESSGRIHVLWTGILNSLFSDYNPFLFYSTSTDGVNWTPYQILSYYMVFDPQVVVDDTNHRVHLMYRSNYDGIVHRTVVNGVVSQPTVLDSSAVTSPRMALDPTTGFVYAVWMQGYLYPLDTGWLSWRSRTWYSYWNGSTWAPRRKLINDEDNNYSTVAAAPGGRVMLAWFQGWADAMGDALGPGKPIVPRSAYAANGISFALRQAVSAPYSLPQKDDSIVLAYSPSDDRFYMACEHLMWPGHSLTYRYVWNGAWSGPLDIGKNTGDWSAPLYVGTAPGVPFVYYVYTSAGVVWARRETGGVLGTAENLTQYLTDRGYNASGAYFLDRTGTVHMVVTGTKDGVAGFYYLHQ